MKEGIIVSIKYGTYTVYSEGVFFNTSPRGTLSFKNKFMVGDKVLLSEENYIIEALLDRKSSLKRPMISNIDQILLVFSLKEPDFSYYLAFKYLTYANYNGIKASLVLTKSDKSEEKEIDEIKNVFSQIGIDTYVTCSKNSEGIEEIKTLFKDKISVLIGQSGVGKSSLLNAISEDFSREVGEYSIALGRGKHQTKEVILLPYMGGFIADTPGFSSLELDMDKLDVAHYFPSFEKDSLNCFYSNCLHISEKNCKIKERILEGKIPSIVYDNYLKLLEEVERR